MLKFASLIRPLQLRPFCQITRLGRLPVSVVRPRGAQTSIFSPCGPQMTVRSIISEREVSPKIEAAFREKDKIPDNYHIVYRAPLQYYIAVTYTAVFLTNISAPAIAGFVFYTSESRTFPMELAGIPLFESINDVYIMAGLIVLTMINVGHTVTKYPFRIYRDPVEDKYIAVFQHFIPLLKSKVKFKAGEIKKAPGWIWKESVYAIKKKKVLLIPERFSTPAELNRMTIDPKTTNPLEVRKRRSRNL